MTEDYALHARPVSPQLVLSREEWISVLRLSTFWYFLEYRKMAITQLEKVGFFSPIDRVLYGREYRVQSWVRQGFEQLITREEPIEKEDALLINFETTFSLFRLRERRIRGHSSAFSSSFNTSDAVRQTFKNSRKSWRTRRHAGPLNRRLCLSNQHYLQSGLLRTYLRSRGTFSGP